MVVIIRTHKVVEVASYIRARKFDALANGKIFYEGETYPCSILYEVDGASFAPSMVQIFKEDNRDDCFDIIDLKADISKFNGVCMGTHLERI